MADVPKKVAERLIAGIKKFKPEVDAARTRDANESDTSSLVMDIVAEVFGYQKRVEVTTEVPVKHSCCDLAINIDNQPQVIIEVKHVGHKLNAANIDQLVGYVGDTRGVEWGVLTNGQCWEIYHVFDEKPPREELVIKFDFLELDHKSDSALEMLYLLCKEGWIKSAIETYDEQRRAMSRFIVGAAILSDEGLIAIRKAIQRTVKDDDGIRIAIDDIRTVIENEVIKREVLEDPRAETAKKKVNKAAKNPLKETAAV